MKMIVVTDVWAVGMHHWGGRTLNIGSGYSIEWDTNNPKDPSAVCIKEEGKIKAYLKRDNAFIICNLMKRGVSRVWLLKPKEEPEVKSQRVGPQQRCNIGFKCTDQNLEEAKTYLKRIMPKKRVKIRNYQSYDDDHLQKALSAVRTGELSQRKAAKFYGVPQATLSDHIRGRVDEGALPGRKPVLPRKIEADIAERSAKAAEMGMGISRIQLMQKVGRVTQELKIKTPFKKHVPGKDWWKGFTRRNPSVTLRSPEKLTSVRARGLNPVTTGNYFSDLSKILRVNNLEDKPHKIWNMDEKGVSMEYNPVKVVASKSSRSVPGRVANSRQSNTIIACINASGNSMPPMIIVKGKTEKSLRGFNMLEGPTGSKWTYQQNAWTEDILGVEWFKGVFLKHCGEGRPQLLILDGHHSHETLGLIEAARVEDIILLCLPPHTTHYLCPLDRTVFGPLSKEYNKLCSDFVNCNPVNTIDKKTWPKIFSESFNTAVSASNIISGFRSCGIYPFCPLSVPAVAFAPSVVSSTCSSSIQLNVSHPLKWVLDKLTTGQNQNAENRLVTEEDTDHDKENVPGPVDNMSVDPLIGGNVSIDDDFSVDIESSAVLHEILIPTNIEGPIDLPFSLTDIETDANVVTSSLDWDFAISNLFQLPSPPEKKKASKVTCHRLLTADEVFQQKTKEEEGKKQKQNDKESRKKLREMKIKIKKEMLSQKKENKPLNKKVKRVQSCSDV